MLLDLNCDLGEGCPHDADLMPLITSANISCGGHAGDVATARGALRRARQLNVQCGAHPGYADREHFGRRELERTEEQIYTECVDQIGALAVLARMEAVGLHYVKPHGALYNQACRDAAYARPIVAAAKLYGLPVIALPNSALEAACAGHCSFVPEGFADRRYRADGSLVPRSKPDALVADADEAVHQAEWLLRTSGIRTLCLHGDNPQALDFARALRVALTRQGIVLQRF